MEIFYVDGKFVREDEARISVWDHGFLYGDGIFEGIAAYNGRIFKLDEHVDRLYRSANAIDLQMPLTKEDLKRIIVETVRKNNFRDAYIRPQISRGIGPLGCDPKREKCKQPTIVVYVVPPLHEARPISEKACTAIITSTRRNPPVCIPATIKATQYLNNILAKIESNRVGVDAAIMLDIRGFVSEGSGDNISMIRDGILINPPISCSILEGITRKVIMEIANELDIPVQESDIVPSELYGADEVFLSSTGSEITPIVQIDGRLIGNGKPGPTTTKIEARFRELVQTTGTPIYE